MRILIENSGYHLRNLGDVAMLQAGCLRLRRILPDARLQVVTSDPERLARFCPEAEAVSAHEMGAWGAARTGMLPLRALPNWLQSHVRKREEDVRVMRPEVALQRARRRRQGPYAQGFERAVEYVEAADCVIGTGGGYLCDAFPVQMAAVLRTLRLAQERGKPTALFGQGIGPLKDARRSRWVAKALGQAQLVTLREEAGALSLCGRWGVDFSRMEVTGDDALEVACTVEAAQACSGVVGLNVRLASYAGLGDRAREWLSQALERCASETGMRWLPLPVDLGEGENDERAVQDMAGEGTLDSGYQRPEDPAGLVRLAGQCQAVVTGSYHAAVFALAQGVPVVGLVGSPYYASKFAGLQGFWPELVRAVEVNAQVGTALPAALASALVVEDARREEARTRALELRERGRTAWERLPMRISSGRSRPF